MPDDSPLPSSSSTNRRNFNLSRAITSRQSMADLTRSQLIDIAAEELADSTEPTSLFATIDSHLVSLNYRFGCGTQHQRIIEIDIHEMWFKFCLAAQITAADSPYQERLAALVVRIRESLPLIRVIQDRDSDQIVEKGTEMVAEGVDGGRMWADLPYLVVDLSTCWDSWRDMDQIRRVNLAAFIAKLAGLGVRDTELCSLVLPVMKEALEVEPSTSDEVGRVKTADVLPLCREWLKFAGFKIIGLMSSNTPPSGHASWMVSLGQLARTSGLTEHSPAIQRWLFWRERMGVLAREKVSDSEIQKQATKCFWSMVRQGLHSAVEVPGERNFSEKLRETMGEAMKARGVSQISSEDVEVDFAWAN